METEENTVLDLFGVPIPTARSRGGKGPALPMREESQPEEAVSQEKPHTTILLPAINAIEGWILKNPLKQVAQRARYEEGYFEPLEHPRLSGFRFFPSSGEPFLIVSKPTLAAVGGSAILLVPGAISEGAIKAELAAGKGSWLSPKTKKPLRLEEGEITAALGAVLSSWKGAFTFREGEAATDTNPATKGLRKPQVGALHAALAHATSSTDAATIVMPTGTGKTETMLAIYAHERIERLLVVVPTDALRDQVASKFETMGVLQEQGCLSMEARYPAVLRIEHIPKSIEEVDALFARANVIVTTMSIAGRAAPSIQERMAQSAGALFIDEAHHIRAKTWRDFRAWFVDAAHRKPVYQFTATPFREDGGKVDGKFIYYYPLAKAQAEDYFGKIEFKAVSDLEPDEADDEILRQVGETLRRDLEMGFQHLAMVRCKTIGRAKALHKRYSNAYPNYSPVLVHSDQTTAERTANLSRLRNFQSRIIVCVDMLGEGFDLPELKIAGVHDVFASVAVTLQFVGRFARARTDLGTATLIANTDQDRVDRALAKLYAEESDWNFLISSISADRVGREMDRAAMFEGFKGELPEIPLQTIEPTMNAFVFVARDCERWDPHRIEDCVETGSFVGMKLNEHERIAVCVLRHELVAKWTNSSSATNVDWELVLAHWDEEKGMLYLSSSGGAATDAMAKAICGDATIRVRDQEVFRSFFDFRQLVIRNLGMTHRQGGGTRYSMLMGVDVSDGIDSLIKTERIQNNIFGSGFEDGEPRTLGCSIKGKFWSHAKVHDLSEWTRWCHRIGALLTNDSIPVSAAFASAMRPRQIEERPDAHPLAIHWPLSVLYAYEERVALYFGSVEAALTECDLTLASSRREGPLSFNVSSGDYKATFEVRFNGNDVKYVQTAGPACSIKRNKGTIPIGAFFENDAPQIDFGDGSFLIYSHLYVPPEEFELSEILGESIVAWDWSGTNLRVESQGQEKKPESIQYRTIEELKKNDYDIIFDDDGTGEFADVIAIKIRDTVVEVTMCHCKYASTDTGAARLDDVYEVAGQALKSVQFCHKPKRFLRNMIARERSRIEKGLSSRFERGSQAALRKLNGRWDQYRFEYRVWIVQPALSKAALTPAILQLLGFVEKSLVEHRRIPLRVIVRE